MKQQNVVILGASEKEGRYARMAQEELVAHGHFVFPITRDGAPNLGVAGYRSLAEIPEKIDTISVYLRAEYWRPFVPAIIERKVSRVILNPGTEDAALKNELTSAGVQVLEACTLVMLRTGQFQPDSRCRSENDPEFSSEGHGKDRRGDRLHPCHD